MVERHLAASGSPFEPRIGFSRAVRVGDRVLVAGTAPVWPDGSCDPDAGVQVQRHFAERIAAGPRARDGAEHRRIRRQENQSVHSNLASYQADLGMAQAPIFDFACECATLGCRERVLLSIDEYGTAVAQPDRFVVVRAHLTQMDVQAAPLGEAGCLVDAGPPKAIGRTSG